MNLPFS